jgi:type III restriction enzyme
MPRIKKLPTSVQPSILDVSATQRTAICVPAIRQEIDQWRAADYQGITATTRRLLQWWFKNEHRTPQGATFKYYAAQQEAIEALIYLYEVKKIRRRGELLLTYGRGQRIALPQQDEFARYALKMATGSGKTKVMSLVIAWQYFNAVQGEGDEYATTFLLLSPNVIVHERLMLDFAGGRVFETDPVIPPELKILWDFDVYLRGDSERTKSEGALYVTNIQQLYDRDDEDDQPLNPIDALLGKKLPSTLQPLENFTDRIARRKNCLVLVDEAHHLNDGAVANNNVVYKVHKALGERGLNAQLDFSATPRQSDGTLFTWTIYDYPLKQAIVDNVVKRPLKGVAQGISEVHSDKASVRYEPYLVAAVERWQEYRDQLEPLRKKPILFIMLGNTKEADDVASWMRIKYPACFDGDKLLVIHTNTSGEISKADLEVARVTARQVDEEKSPVNCIVSVLMLREGWDVSNVTVVAGLRPYTAKANVLPEQAVGRGLRLMFRDQTGYREHVDIIGNSNFMQIVEDLEKEEGIRLDTFEYGKKRTPLVIPTIQVVTERIPDYDIAIPVLTPRIERRKQARQIIENLDISKIRLKVPLALDRGVKPLDAFTYEGRDVISDEVIVERTYTMPQAQTSSEIIAFYAQIIAASLKLPSQFSALAPKIEQFLREKAFGSEVELDDAVVLQALNQSRVLSMTEKVFLVLLRPLLTEEKVPTLTGEARMLSTTPPFGWSGKVVEAKKTLFNLTPCDNEYEQTFARFLDAAPDVAAFANVGNLTQTLSIEYLDGEANLRYYEPDFVARDAGGVHWLLETKGREDPDVSFKNARAEKWCEDVTELSGVTWRFQIVRQKDYNKLNPQTLSDLISGLTAGGLLFVEV